LPLLRTQRARVLSRRVAARRSYDSKKETGCVGLRNQGATCYMNSLLQTLFHLPYFRKARAQLRALSRSRALCAGVQSAFRVALHSSPPPAPQAVYHMPTTEAELPESSIPLALQSLFYKLQFGTAAASTRALTQSFGWDSAESFTQHDVQELNRVLCDKLEEKMKGTRVEGTMAALFEGHTETYLECTEVAYASTKRESFMDLQLDVKGCRDVAASFAKYVEEERMDGDNQYRTDSFGLQNAVKGTRFTHFPPVLQLQLKRFEYDFARDAMGKVHDRYEFPEELDLNQFLHVPPHADAAGDVAAAAAPPPDARYCLHSVLVHSGGAHGGHYYAFVRPAGPGGAWLKFDDERVTKESASLAVQDNYGEGGAADPMSIDADAKTPPLQSDTYHSYAPAWKAARTSSAYMLVYVRACDLGRIVCDVTSEDIPDHVRARLAAEAAEKARCEKEREEAHLYTIVKAATDADIGARVCARDTESAFDLVDHARVAHIRVAKTAPFSDFKALAAEWLGVPVAAQRWWLWAKRQNGTFRPSRLVTSAEEGLPVSAIRDAPPALGSALLSGGGFVSRRIGGVGHGGGGDGAAAELLLLLETPWPPQAAGAPPPPPPPPKGDTLLFFKASAPFAFALVRFCAAI
jgi:ubiquitin carboxyl-terminal hydrolase 7